MSTELAVLMPLRPFGRGKTRLSERFDEATRAGIAHALALRALEAARTAFPDAALYVVGAPELLGFVERRGALLLPDPPACLGLPHAVDAALDALELRGHRRALVLMGDLPDVDVDALRQLDDPAFDVVLAENATGRGTNAMIVRLPRPFETAFGDPTSADLHDRRAHDAGCRTMRLRLRALARDVDLPADVDEREVPAWLDRARHDR